MTGAALVLSVVDGRSRVVHLVAVEAALHRRSGCYPSLCDTEVIAASMLTEPGTDCQDCQTRAQGGADQMGVPIGRGGSGLWRRRRSRRARSGTPGRRRGPHKRDGGLGR
ncbi:MAG: hypothetical protein ACRDTE_07730 [Pseudonocardiaceae bacterium]